MGLVELFTVRIYLRKHDIIFPVDLFFGFTAFLFNSREVTFSMGNVLFSISIAFIGAMDFELERLHLLGTARVVADDAYFGLFTRIKLVFLKFNICSRLRFSHSHEAAYFVRNREFKISLRELLLRPVDEDQTPCSERRDLRCYPFLRIFGSKLSVQEVSNAKFAHIFITGQH
jgi:hypothetical protein